MILKGLSSAAATGVGAQNANNNYLGTQGMTINYDTNHARHQKASNQHNRGQRGVGEEEEFDQDEFNGEDSNEEYIRVQNMSPDDGQDGQESYSIIPFNNVHQHNPDSQYYDEDEMEGDISIEENKKTLISKPSSSQHI